MMKFVKHGIVIGFLLGFWAYASSQHMDVEFLILTGTIAILCVSAYQDIYGALHVDAQSFAISTDACRRFYIRATKPLPFRKIYDNKLRWKMHPTQISMLVNTSVQVIHSKYVDGPIFAATFPVRACGIPVEEDPAMTKSSIELYHEEKLILRIDSLFVMGEENYGQTPGTNSFNIPAPQH